MLVLDSSGAPQAPARGLLRLLRDAHQLRASASRRGALRRGLHRLRSLLRWLGLPRAHADWLHFMLDDPRLRAIAARDPSLLERHCHTYLCRGLSRRERLQRLHGHYRFALAALPPALLAAVYVDGGHCLGTLAGKDGAPFSLWLHPPARCGRESELGLYLKDADGQALCSLFFVVDAQAARIEIGCLQGAAAGLGKDAVRAATRACHGLRPKNLLLSMLYALAARHGIDDLRGVGNRHQAAPREGWRGRKVLADYDAFWQSAGGVADARGMFRLPPHEAERLESEVESRKRAEFRRREQLRASACQLLLDALDPAPPMQAVA